MAKPSPSASVADDAHMGRLRWMIFLISLPFGILLFMLPIVGRDMGATAVEIGGLFSAFALITVILRPLVGRALDRYGRKPFFLVGLLSYSLANLLYGFSDSVGMLYLARLAQGLGSGLVWLSACAMVADLVGGEERGGRYGQIEEMSARGGILGVFIVFGLMSFLGQSKGWKVGFGLYAAFGLAAVMIAWLNLPETRPTREPRRNDLDAESSIAGDTLSAGSVLSLSFCVLMAVVSVTAAAYALTGPILMIYLLDHVTRDLGSLALAFLPAALISATMPSRFGRLSDRWGRRLPMAMALIVGGVVAWTIPQARSLVPLILLWAAQATCFAAATPAEEALVADLSPEKMRGLAFGLYTSAASFGAVVGPLLGGWLYQSQGEQAPFFVNAFLLWLGALAIILLLRVPKPARPVSPTSEPTGSVP